MSEQTKPGQFLNEAPINTTNLLFDDEARPDNELIDENADYRNEYYQETNFLYSNIGKPQAADGDDPADPGILTGTLHGDVYETYQLFASGDQLAAVVKGFGVASTVTDLFEAVASGNYLDPFSWLGGQVMSWMLEHVEPMRKTLEAIAGSPDIVAAYSTSWENIATELDEVAAGWAQAVVTGTAEWIGETADAYRAAAAEQIDKIGGWSANASVLAQLNEQMGKLVETVRGLIAGILASLAQVLVEITVILLATVGTGAVAATARAMFSITSATLQVSTVLSKLAKAIFDLEALAIAAAQAIATIAKIEQIA
ncbi:MAG TPA: hypothetical protein VK083_09675 [Nocardia sp.]|uniref:hypothetical protein n=1 Tax=Nocardia sp. TaxID=1821 RepID=UPI002B4AB4E3|nr:hypothetical protein [Nocardia sp.]HLS77045.1 hypothetical protein [Nocardia sp.]